MASSTSILGDKDMASVTVEVRGRDSLMDRLRKYLKLRGDVRAGVLSGATTPDGKSVLEYAPVQEFGGHINVTPKMRGFLAANYGIYLNATTTEINIPPRPFLRTTMQAHKDEWIKILGKAINAGKDAQTALEYVGIRMRDDIIAQIASNMPPPNSAATDLIKQKDAPANVGRTLMHTGTLAHSIEYEVDA